MKDKLLEIVKNEDPRNPYTDDLLAGLLNIRRDRVTLLRKELNVPDSRERRRPVLMRDMQELLASFPDITNMELTARLQAQGYQLSRFIVSQTRKQLVQPTSAASGETLTAELSAGQEKETHTTHLSVTASAFDKVIGARGSLKRQIKQAKAAVLYPPYGLHIIISGATGVGKSSLVEAIHRFGIESGKFADTAPLVVFNCADYADNPQLLLSQLFGHTKGALTGAAVAKSGLVEKANGGILFLDEVHRLPPEGQEMLFYLIDNGKYRRLGDTEAIHSVSVMIIAATTENITSSLLLTFRRRIPMFIELPPLSDRPPQERFEMITRFAATEAAHIGSPIAITKDAVSALMRYECPGNIGQLRSDIQVACARGYLGHLSDGGSAVRVGLLELPFHVDSKMLLVGNKDSRLNAFIADDLIVDQNSSVPLPHSFHKKNPFHGDIYQYLEKRIGELQKQNVPTETINAILGEETKQNFSQFLSHFEYRSQNVAFDEVCSRFDPATLESIYIIRDILQKSNYPDCDYLYYCIGTHLEATRKRLEDGRMIYNPQMAEIQENYPQEYAMGLAIIQKLREQWGRPIPEDEAGYLAMYLQLNRKPAMSQERVGIVLASHGKLASSILEVVNHLNPDQKNIVAVDLPLQISPKESLLHVAAAIQQVNMGRGVALLVDMGSLSRMGKEAAEESGVPICVVDRMETVMVLQALEKASTGACLEDVCAIAGKANTVYTAQTFEGRKNAILTICITGLGAAITFKEMIESSLDASVSGSVEVLPIGYLNEQGLHDQIQTYQQEYNIIAATGTVRPNLSEIPFITIQELIEGSGLSRLLGKLQNTTPSEEHPHGAAFWNWKILDIFRLDCIAVYDSPCHKAMVIEHLCQLLQSAGCVTDQYMLDVYRREMLGPTIYRNAIAIPHGTTQNVLHPAVAVGLLPAPIEWMPDVMVDKVFLLALPEDSHDVVCRLRQIFDDKSFLSQISALHNPSEIKDILTEHILLNVSSENFS